MNNPSAKDQVNSMMSFPAAVKSCFIRYHDFSGTSSRAEYWWWTAFTVLVFLPVSVIDTAIFGRSTDNEGPLSLLLSMATLLPTIAVALRRSNDAGLNWAVAFPQIAAVILGTLYSTVSYTAGMELPIDAFSLTTLLWIFGAALVAFASVLIVGLKRSINKQELVPTKTGK